jgi:hypothetical protein
LGPLLFNLFINDIVDIFDSKTVSKLFADDIKIYTEINFPSDNLNFQKNLDLISSWASTWQLHISHSKCFILELGQTHAPTNYVIDNSEISFSDSIKDLGVIVDPKLKFTNHISELVRRANQRASLIHRCFLSRNTANLIKAFKVYVRPILEYASSVWSPSHIGLINGIENVQRRFTKRLPGLSDLSYTERLTTLQLHSLEHRRLNADLATCFSIVNGLNSLIYNEFFSSPTYHTTRGHSHKISIPLARTDTRKLFFACRVVNPWNSLDEDTVAAPNIKSFKTRLLKADLSKFLIHPYIALSHPVD